jgi:hypothetical protein
LFRRLCDEAQLGDHSLSNVQVHEIQSGGRGAQLAQRTPDFSRAGMGAVESLAHNPQQAISIATEIVFVKLLANLLVEGFISH